MNDSAPTVRYAGFWRRVNAYGLDSLLVSILCVIADQFVGDASAQSPETIQALVDAGMVPSNFNSGDMIGSLFPMHDILLLMIVSSIYNILFIASKWQATPGKRWQKCIVVMAGDFRRLTLLESTIRQFVSFLSTISLLVGYFMVGFTRQKTALHDIICNTRVIMR